MKEFLEKLAHGSIHHASSDHLKILGKRAAGLYATKEADSLTEAVASVVEEEGSLNRDQVSRIAEMANQETWRSLFVENQDPKVQFAPADATEVIGAMAEKPEEMDPSGLQYLEYLQDPVGEEPSGDLAAAFGLTDVEEPPSINPVRGEEIAVEKTASAVDVSRYSVDNAASLLAAAGEKLYGLVKRAHLDDELGILQISRAVAASVEDPQFATSVMQQIGTRLEREGVRFNQKEELKKVAHTLVVNPDHPLVSAAAELERAAYAFYSSSESHEKLAATHRKASKYLRDKMRAM